MDTVVLIEVLKLPQPLPERRSPTTTILQVTVPVSSPSNHPAASSKASQQLASSLGPPFSVQQYSFAALTLASGFVLVVVDIPFRGFHTSLRCVPCAQVRTKSPLGRRADNVIQIMRQVLTETRQIVARRSQTLQMSARLSDEPSYHLALARLAEHSMDHLFQFFYLDVQHVNGQNETSVEVWKERINATQQETNIQS